MKKFINMLSPHLEYVSMQSAMTALSLRAVSKQNIMYVFIVEHHFSDVIQDTGNHFKIYCSWLKCHDYHD